MGRPRKLSLLNRDITAPMLMNNLSTFQRIFLQLSRCADAQFLTTSGHSGDIPFNLTTPISPPA